VWYRSVFVCRMHDAILQKLMLDSPLYAPPVHSHPLLMVGRPVPVMTITGSLVLRATEEEG
jgi:hypothetical protein